MKKIIIAKAIYKFKFWFFTIPLVISMFGMDNSFWFLIWLTIGIINFIIAIWAAKEVHKCIRIN